ncbi:fungal trichothecene efflux pump [Dactylonectria macrodidyma]|uniref:Fungal trichothecene efflux pump n=1 Tax=Dactylonectria macrodidyma TaxID=307937 RepID=A0A9P9DVP3_9HYPO|nr:fungal trichothecene efflux pump [Dactylonectria macrodidyma]
MSSEDKIGVTHAGFIQPANTSDGTAAIHLDEQDGSGPDDIVAALQHTGEEVGMTWRSFMAAASMAMSYNAYLFTLLIPPAILSFINAELGPETTYTWITISWNLGGAIFVTIGGRLSDIFGRRWFFICGAATLVLGAIVGATGQSIGQMIASGAIFGSGAGLLEMAFGAVQEIVPNEWRMVTIGLFDASSIIAQLMPITSWAIIKYTGEWRNAYYVMIAFQVFNTGFLWAFYHPPSFRTKHGTSTRTKPDLLKSFDWIGLVMFMVGCTLFIIGVNWGGTLHPWKSAASLAPIILGLLILVALGFYEAYGNIQEPLLPARLFKQVRHFTMPMIVMSVVGMQYYSNATLWPRMSQLLYATDEISKGLYAEVVPLGTILGGIAVLFSKKLGHQRWQIVFFIALQTGCVGALSTSTIENPVKSIILTVIVSMTTALVMLNCFVLVGFGIVDQNDIGTAAGLAGTARLIAGAIAVAIFGNVTNGRYATALPVRVPEEISGLGFDSENMAALIAAARLNTPAAYAAVPGITDEIQAAATRGNQLAYLDGAHLSYLIAMAFGIVGCIAAFWIPSIDRRKYTKKTVALQEQDRKILQEKKLQGPSA